MRNLSSYRNDQIPQHKGPSRNREAQTYLTHGDLVRMARRMQCRGIATEPVLALCRPEKNFWAFKATVYESAHCRGFAGYGD